MKIIILRHFKRHGCPLFNTSLTVEGLKDAENIIEELNKLLIDDIYCSPFLRTIQSIYPYAKKFNIKLKIDNSLYEATNDQLFTDENIMNNYHSHFENNPDFKNIIDNDYRNYLLLYKIYPQEGNERLLKRVHDFIENVILKSSEKTILIVTHQSICNAIKKFFNKNVKISDKFPMGNYEIIDLEKKYDYLQ